MKKYSIEYAILSYGEEEIEAETQEEAIQKLEDKVGELQEVDVMEID